MKLRWFLIAFFVEVIRLGHVPIFPGLKITGPMIEDHILILDRNPLALVINQLLAPLAEAFAAVHVPPPFLFWSRRTLCRHSMI